MRVKKLVYCLGMVLLCSCSDLVYENDSYSIYADKVVQGEYTGVAETPYKIVSNLNGEQIALFDLSGRMLYATQTTTSMCEFNVACKGVYILRINGFVTKIIVK